MSRLEPTGRTLIEFMPLWPGERKLVDACRIGEAAALGSGRPECASPETRVRASFLRFLLLGGDEQSPVHEHGVHLKGAWVEGALDLKGCYIAHGVSLFNCLFDSLVVAEEVEVNGTVRLSSSYLALGLVAKRLRCSASLYLDRGFKAAGTVNLIGAQIDGDLDCDDGMFEAEKSFSLSIVDAVIKGNLNLAGAFIATREVSLIGAQINGDLNCHGAKFAGVGGSAISADRVSVKGNVFLDETCQATGEVSLAGALIGGDVVCSGSRFKNAKGRALSLDNATINGNVYLNSGFKASGSVVLDGAHIGGDVECSPGSFFFKGGTSLQANDVVIGGSLHLNKYFKATGDVWLAGAQVGSDLNCNGGQFKGAKNALVATGIVVKGNVDMDGEFKASGCVCLTGAQIDGDLDCTGGQFESKRGPTLLIQRAAVQGSLILGAGFRTSGLVNLRGTRIEGDLICTSGAFKLGNDAALSIRGVIVLGSWIVQTSLHPVRIDAAHATVAVMEDEPGSWAPASVLDGLRYTTIGGRAPSTGRARLKWLNTQSNAHIGRTRCGADFRPQPWRQVQKVLREMGHIEDAKQVGVAFEDHIRAIGRIGRKRWLNWLWRNRRSLNLRRRRRFGLNWNGLKKWSFWTVSSWSHYAFGILAGYGYRPFRLLAWMISVWLLFGAFYWCLALPPYNALAPSDPLVFQNEQYKECRPDNPRKEGNWYLCIDLRGEYATFSPVAFSLDVLLPLVDLGQEKTWGAFVPTPKAGPLSEFFGHFEAGHLARILIWLETLFGWVSSLLLVAIVSGFSRRSDEG